MSTLETLKQNVIDGNAARVTALVNRALSEGVPPAQILNTGLIEAMREVGRLFESGEYFIPEMLISARAMKNGLELLRPRLVEANIQAAGKVVIGTVKGDLHDIGKNLVAMMLEGAGLEVIDLGVDVSVEKFVSAVKEERPQFIGLSALLTTTMPAMKAVIEAFTQAGIRDQVHVLVGGAPVTQKFADEIGADVYAPDASSAATRVRALLA